jgi:hypothetical protein
MYNGLTHTNTHTHTHTHTHTGGLMGRTSAQEGLPLQKEPLP